MTTEDIEVFKRKWLCESWRSRGKLGPIADDSDYFCYCEVGFAERVIGDHIFTLVREGNDEYGCVVYE